MDTLEALLTPPIDLEDVDLVEALHLLSAKTGVNITISPGVEGRVTAHFERPVPFLKALNFILETHGCRYEVVDNVIKVSKVKVPLLVRSFSLRYALAEEVAPSVKALLSKDGSLEVNKKTNTLVVTDTAERIEKVKESLAQLDTLEKQTSTMSFPLRYVLAEKIFPLVKENLSPRGILKVDPSTNTLLVTDTNYALFKLSSLVQGLDVFKPETKVFSLKFALAKEIAELLRSELSERGTVEVRPERNEILVSDAPYNLRKIEDLVLSCDEFEKQVQKKSFPIKYIRLEEASEKTAPLLSSKGRMSLDEERSIIYVEDASYSLHKVEELLKELDVFRPKEKVYRIRYAPCSEVARRISSYLSDKAEVKVEEKTGTITVRDVEKNIEKVDELIEKMDTLEGQLITKKYFLKYLSPSEAAFSLEGIITDYGKVQIPASKEEEKEKEDYVVIPEESPSKLKGTGSKRDEAKTIDRNVIYVTDLKKNIPLIDQAIEKMNSPSYGEQIATKTFYIKEGSLEQVAITIANMLGISTDQIQGIKTGEEKVKWMKIEISPPSIDLGNIGALGKK